MKTGFKKLSKGACMLICLAFIFLLAGCASGGHSDKPNDSAPANTKIHPSFLTDHEWIHYNFDPETISFQKDGTYAYYCACGNAVGDSDLFDSYSYNEDTSEITLSPVETDHHIIRVLRYEKSRLLLAFDDGITEFIDANDPLMNMNAPDISYDSNNYTEGYSSYIAIIDHNETSFTTAPADYDKNNPNYESYLLTEKKTDNTKYYLWTMQITQEESGDTISHNLQELSEEQVNTMLSEGPQSAYIWYNSNMEIEKILFFDQLSTTRK